MMSTPNHIDSRLWALTNADYNGTISEQERRELELLLDDDPIAQAFYVDFLTINAELLWMFSAKQYGEVFSQSQTSPAHLAPPTERSPVLGFLGDWTNFINQHSPLSYVLLLMVFGATLVTTTYLLTTRNSSQTPAESIFVAQITATKDCQWGKATESPTNLESLSIGRQLNLEKGIVEITYSNKAQVVIEGPTSYTVDSPKSGSLSQGKLYAKADSEQSRQFTIITPNAKYVDLGTEFGVKVDGIGHSEVAVFAGKVNAAAKQANGRWATPISLQKGEAVVCEEMKFASQVAQRGDFPSLQSLPPPPPNTTFQRWLDVSRELQNRNDLVAYYDFQPDANNSKVLTNRAPTGAALNGEIQNATWVHGRFPEKSALEFMEADSGVRVNLPGEYKQLTVIAWVNNKQFANGLNGILMSDDWDQPKKLHLQIKNTGQIILNVRGQISKLVNGQEYHTTTKSIPAENLKSWCMIAGVVDTPNQCTLYVNGEFFETLESTQIPSIRIGSALIGGWNRGTNQSPDNLIRNFSGRIDEMMIFQNALTAEEIKRLYESGKP